MSFQAFIDDSGSGQPVFVLSGYISLDYWWEDFSDEWQLLLDEAPKLAYFKMREAANLSQLFAGMKAEDRNQRIKKFFSLIRICAHAAVISVIPVKLFDSIVKTNVQQPEFEDPYFVSLFEIIIKVLEQQIAMNSADSIEFIFDNNPRIAAKVPYYYQLTRTLLRPELRDLIAPAPRFEDDRNFLPLQAADAQSWYYRRLFAERITQHPFHRHLTKALFSDLDRIPTLMTVWTRERCEYFVHQGQDREGPIPQLKDVHELLQQLEFD